MAKFRKLSSANRIDFMFWYKRSISKIYAANVALECLRDGVGNRIWPKNVSYNLITNINDVGVDTYYYIVVH